MIDSRDHSGDQMSQFRGSKRHMLEWINRPMFVQELNTLLSPCPVTVDSAAKYLPRGTEEPREARLGSFGPSVLPHPTAWKALRSWWLAHPRGNTPNWDFASPAKVNGAPGLVLMEAKANLEELSSAPKS